MLLHCSRCHHQFEAEPEAACPRCKAEAGVEPEHGVPVPMRLFGLLLGAVIVATVSGGLLSRFVG
jgi:uncharacterized paraquat-inducible protein A